MAKRVAHKSQRMVVSKIKHHPSPWPTCCIPPKQRSRALRHYFRNLIFIPANQRDNQSILRCVEGTIEDSMRLTIARAPGRCAVCHSDLPCPSRVHPGAAASCSLLTQLERCIPKQTFHPNHPYLSSHSCKYSDKGMGKGLCVEGRVRSRRGLIGRRRRQKKRALSSVGKSGWPVA